MYLGLATHKLQYCIIARKMFPFLFLTTSQFGGVEFYDFTHCKLDVINLLDIRKVDLNGLIFDLRSNLI